MPGSLPHLQDYYLAKFNVSDAGGSPFVVEIAFARADTYNGDGTEMGDGSRSGARQLRRVCDKIGEGLGRVWANPVTLVSVRANTSTTLAINLPASD